MWWIYIVIGVAVVLIVLFVFSYFEAKKSSINLSEETFKASMRKGQLIDIRQKKDFEEGHINGARNMPYAQLAIGHAKLRKDQPIFLYDMNGRKAKRVAMFLQSKGFHEIYQLDKGLESWKDPLKTKK